ncbi:MAG: hypothetical protein FJ403_12120 [Verrucomicrobia bacterium]|nr:hypothetical protein [Verrucomicrobiota bacterium]
MGQWLLRCIDEAAQLAPPHQFSPPKQFKSSDGKVVAQVGNLREAVEQLRRLEKPFLNWTGKAERLSFDVPTLPLFIHERLSTKAIIETLKGHKTDKPEDFFRELWGDPQHSVTDQVLLLRYESLGEQVQMIYIDPPYGVKFGSNFQPFVRKRDVAHNDDEDMTREPEMVQAYRDTWELGLHSYLTYLRDRLLLARELLHPSGSIFVQISDENLHHVREVMDEVFGAECFICTIVVKKKGSQKSSLIDPVNDYLLWYGKTARHEGRTKFRPLFGFLFARPGSLLLIDEPDAHLHVILQELIWSRLRRLAADTRSQLIVATHAEVFINAVEPDEVCLCFERPRLLRDVAERSRLTAALRSLSNVDLMLAQNAPGVLYTGDWTDLEILRAWARVLNHPVSTWLEHGSLEHGIMWKPKVVELRSGSAGVPAREHYEALRLVREDLPALELVDVDAHPNIQSQPITGEGFQRQRWRRYEIEGYLFHPAALERYVIHLLGMDETPGAAAPNLEALRAWMNDNLPPAVVRDPVGEHTFLNNTKARVEVLPPLLAAAGLPGLPYTRYAEIATLMRPEEIHPEVREKLDAIQHALRL